MNNKPEELVENISQLTSFSDVAFRINEILADEKSSVADIGAVIEPDPALSAALLRIANSALYARRGSVDSIGQAIAIVGTRSVRDLAFGICATEAFKGIPNELISAEDFWKHSLYCAVAAQHLAQSAKVCAGQSLFTAGLLHDIGQLVMFNQCPQLSQRALQLSLAKNDGLSPYLSERDVFGFDHTDVGSALARQWQFPDSLRECIELHHVPLAHGSCSEAALVLHIANSVAVLAELDSSDLDDAPPIDARAFAQLRLSPDVIAEAAEAAQKGTADLLLLFVN